MRTFKSNIKQLFKLYESDYSEDERAELVKFAMRDETKTEIDHILVRYIEYVTRVANLLRLKDKKKRLMTRHVIYAFNILEQDTSDLENVMITYEAMRYVPNEFNKRREHKASLILSVSHCETIIKRTAGCKVDGMVSIYMSSMAESLCRSMLPSYDELIEMHKTTHKKRFNSRQLMLLIETDKRSTLKRVLDKIGVIVYTAGMTPYLPEEFTKQRKYAPKKKDDEPKVRRFRPGVVAVRNIKKYQKNGNLLMRVNPFQDHVREMFKLELDGEVDGKKARFNKDAFILLQKYIEFMTGHIVRESQKMVIQHNREGCKSSDIEMVYRILKGEELCYDELDPKFKNGIIRICYRAGVKRRSIDLTTFIGYVVNALLHQVVITLSEDLKTKKMGVTISMDTMRWAIDLCLSSR